MITRAYVLAVALLPVGQLFGQASLQLTAVPLKDTLLVEVLNDAEMQDLNKLSPTVRKDLSLRLYAVGHSGTCVEETEWVCSYRYVLAVSEFGEVRERTAYDLGEVGEIANIKWLPSDSLDHAVLEFEVRSVPGHAARQNPKLSMRRRRYKLDAGLDHVVLRPVQ